MYINSIVVGESELTTYTPLAALPSQTVPFIRLAVAVLFDIASDVNKSGSIQKAALLKQLGDVLGLLQQNPQDYLQQRMAAADETLFSPEEIEKMILQRLNGRKAGNYAEADMLREKLFDAGIILEDGPQGTTWRRQ